MRYFGIGPFELLIIGMLVLLIFGSRLPSVMQSLSNGLQQLRCNWCGWLSVHPTHCLHCGKPKVPRDDLGGPPPTTTA
jgi:hypothetical protein